MDGILSFLKEKHEIGTKTLTREDLLKIIHDQNIILLRTDVLNESSSNGEIKAALCYGDGGKSLKHPVLMIGKDTNDMAAASEWFALAHELGHYYLHPFYHRHSRFAKESKKGVLEKEADIFATIIFVPSQELDGLFEDRIIRNFLQAAFKTPEENRSRQTDIIKDMYSYFEEKTKKILSRDNKDLPEPAQRNIHLRLTQYIKEIEEKIIIIFNKPYSQLEERDFSSFNSMSDIVQRVRNAYFYYK